MAEHTFKEFIQKLRENDCRINVKDAWLLWRNFNSEEIQEILRAKRQQAATSKLIRELRAGKFRHR